MDEERLRLKEQAFIEGFRAASDKLGFLLLAQIPTEIGPEGEAALKLVQVKIEDAYEVGSAHPGFGSRELIYHVLPGEMIRQTTRLFFVYVSMTARHEFSLADIGAEVDRR